MTDSNSSANSSSSSSAKKTAAKKPSKTTAKNTAAKRTKDSASKPSTAKGSAANPPKAKGTTAKAAATTAKASGVAKRATTAKKVGTKAASAGKRSAASKQANDSAVLKNQQAAASVVDDNEALLEALGDALADSTVASTSKKSSSASSSKRKSTGANAKAKSTASDDAVSAQAESDSAVDEIGVAVAVEQESQSRTAIAKSKSSASKKNAKKSSENTVSNAVDVAADAADAAADDAAADAADVGMAVSAVSEASAGGISQPEAVAVAAVAESDGAVDVEAVAETEQAAASDSAAVAAEGAEADVDAAAIGVEESAEGASVGIGAATGVAVETSAFYLNRSGLGLVNAFPGTGQKSSLPTSDTSKSEIPTKVMHADGSTLDIRELVSELKELSPELLERAQKEFMGGFAGAANDLMVYRKLEEMGASDSIKDVPVEKLKRIALEYFDVVADALRLDELFNELSDSNQFEQQLEALQQKYVGRFPKLSLEEILFLDDEELKSTSEYVLFNTLVLQTLFKQEELIADAIEKYGFNDPEKRLELDEALFYSYLLACKCPENSSYYNEYQLLVDVSNRIDLFNLMYRNFIDSDSITNAFKNYGVYTQDNEELLDTGMGVYDDIEQIDLKKVDPLHFAYFEPVLSTIIADTSLFDSLKELVERSKKVFNHELNQKVCGNFTYDCDFIPALASYLYGRRACDIGEEAVAEAVSKINNDETRPLFLFDIFMNEEAIANSNINEYQQAVSKFKDTIEEAIQKDEITDDMKEWALHIYHNSEIFKRLCRTIPVINTLGDGTLTTLNMDNERILVEMLFFYSKYSMNQMRKSVLYDAEGEQIPFGSPEEAEARIARELARRKGEHYVGEEFEPKGMVGDNGFIPVIPGTPALSAFLIGRAFTYGEFLAEQNPDFAFTVLKYADFTGSYMATAFVANLYQPLYDAFLSTRGQLLVQQHLRAVLSYQLGELCTHKRFKSLSYYRNKKQYADGGQRSKFYQSLEGKDERLDYIFSLNPTLDDHDRDEGIQPLCVSAYGSILGNTVIALCDLLMEQSGLLDRYAKTLAMLLKLMEKQMASEYSPVCCLAMYRFLVSDYGHRAAATGRLLERYQDVEVLGSLLLRQLMPNGLHGKTPGSVISQGFPLNDVAVMFLQVGMFYSDYRQQGYTLVNAHLDCLRGNFTPLCVPYIDELFRTSAALQNGNALSYMSTVESALGHASKSDLYAIAGTRQSTAKTYKDTVHYLIKNDLQADRAAFAKQMFYFNRPYGYYESYLTLKDDESRRAEAHTYLFYAARMSVSEAISDLEALEKAGQFKPLPFVVYLRYLEELAKSNLQALLILFLLSQNGDILPPNQGIFIDLLENYHNIFSNSTLKRTLMERGYINTAVSKRRIDHQTSWYGMFGLESDILRKSGDEMNGNSGRINSMIEVLELLDLNFLYHNITDLRIQDVIRKLFERLAEGKTDLENKLLFNWSRSEFFPAFLKETAVATLSRLTTIESVNNHCGIDYLMSMYSHVLDASYCGVSGILALNTIKKNSHPLNEASEINTIFLNLTQGGFAHVSVNTMKAFALNALRGFGRPNLGLFVQLNRFIANQGVGVAERITHLDFTYLEDYPYGSVFDRLLLKAKNLDIDIMSKITAAEPINNTIIQTMVEKCHQANMLRKFVTDTQGDENKSKSEDESSIIVNYGASGDALDADADAIAADAAVAVDASSADTDATADAASTAAGAAVAAAVAMDADGVAVDVLASADASADGMQEQVDADKSLKAGKRSLMGLLSVDQQRHVKDAAKDFVKYCHQVIANSNEKVLNDFYSPDRIEYTLHLSMLSEWIDQHKWDEKFKTYIEPKIAAESSDEKAATLAAFAQATVQHSDEQDQESFLKHFIDLEYFRRSQGINLVQTVVFSRNGWQLTRKANGPKRSFASLLAKDFIGGIPGAIERFNYYVQSHRFRYLVNSGFFLSDEHLDTARNFVNDVLQMDISSDKFSEFAESMVSEGFDEFKQLINEEQNGYVKGTCRYVDSSAVYDAETGMTTHPANQQHFMNCEPMYLLRARDDLKLWAQTLDKLSKASVEEREKFFLTSDYETLQSDGDNGLVLRNDLERILGPENIDRLIYGDNQQWINYTFYDRPGVDKHQLLSMLPRACCLLPYRLLQEVDSEDRALILNKSFKAVNHSDNKAVFLKNLNNAEADNINGSEMWGISYEERCSRWNVSKKQLLLQISREYTVYSQDLKDLRVFSSAYNDAQYRFDTLRLQLANVREARAKDSSSLNGSNFGMGIISDAIGSSKSSPSDAAFAGVSELDSSAYASDVGGSISDVDSGSAALLSENNNPKGYSPEEEALWSCINNGEEYTGDLFVSQSEISSETILDRARIIAAAAGSRMAASKSYTKEPDYDNTTVDTTTAVAAVDIGTVISGSSATSAAVDSAADATGNAATDAAASGDASAAGGAPDNSAILDSDTAEVKASKFVSIAGELKDILTTNHADKGLFNSLKDFLSNKLSAGNASSSDVDPLASYIVQASQGGEGSRDDFMKLMADKAKQADSGVAYLRDEFDNKSSVVNYIFAHAWHFNEALDAQYTRPAMFHEDENPLHVMLYIFANVLTADLSYEEKVSFEDNMMFKLYRTGYFYGAADLVDCAMPATVVESYRYRNDRLCVYDDFASEVSTRARSIGIELLSEDDFQQLLDTDANEVNKVTKKLAKIAKMPSCTTKGQLLGVMINSADEEIARDGFHYRTLLCTTKKQLTAGKVPYLCDDSIINPAFIDLYACRELISRCPNLIRLYSAYGYTSADAKDVAPDAHSYKPENRYLSKLRDIVNRVNRKEGEPDYVGMDSRGFLYYDDIKVIQEYERTNKLPETSIAFASLEEQNKLRTMCDDEYAASINIVDSDESSYATDEQAAFHRGCGKTHDLRAYNYLYHVFGEDVQLESLTKMEKSIFYPISGKILAMQQCMNLYHAEDSNYAHPFSVEYIDMGFGLSHRNQWSRSAVQELGMNYMFMLKTYEYSPRMTGELAEFRDTVVLAPEDVEKYQKYFREHPFIPVDNDQNLMMRYNRAGLYDLAREYKQQILVDGKITSTSIEDIPVVIENYEAGSGRVIKTTDQVADDDFPAHKRAYSRGTAKSDADASSSASAASAVDTSAASHADAVADSSSGAFGTYEIPESMKHMDAAGKDAADASEDENLAQKSSSASANDASNGHNDKVVQKDWTKDPIYQEAERAELADFRKDYIDTLKHRLKRNSSNTELQEALARAEEFEELVAAFYAAHDANVSTCDDSNGGGSAGADSDTSSRSSGAASAASESTASNTARGSADADQDADADADSDFDDLDDAEELLTAGVDDRFSEDGSEYEDDEDSYMDDDDESSGASTSLVPSSESQQNELEINDDEDGILQISEDDINDFIDFLSDNELDPTDIESMADMIATAYIQRMRKYGASDNEILQKVFDKHGNFDVHSAFEELRSQSDLAANAQDAVYAELDDDDDDFADYDDDTAEDANTSATATATSAATAADAAKADDEALVKALEDKVAKDDDDDDDEDKDASHSKSKRHHKDTKNK